MIDKNFKTIDIGNKCVDCGRDSSFGSGRFINRVSADRDVYHEDGTYSHYVVGYLCGECVAVCDKLMEEEAQYD